MGVEGGADGLHGADLDGGLIAPGFIGLEAAEAVFGADRAVVAGDDVVDDLRALGPEGEEGGVVAAGRAEHVVVEIAVADVAEGADADAGVEAVQGGLGLVEEVGDARNGHGDVVLPAAALGLLGRRLLLAQLPEGGALDVVPGEDGSVTRPVSKAWPSSSNLDSGFTAPDRESTCRKVEPISTPLWRGRRFRKLVAPTILLASRSRTA